MKPEEFHKAKKEILAKRDTELKDLCEKYLCEKYAYAGNADNAIEIGDIITDHWHTIKVDKIGIDLDYDGLPECVFFGVRFTKKGQPTKRKEQSQIWQSNIIKRNKK